MLGNSEHVVSEGICLVGDLGCVFAILAVLVWCCLHILLVQIKHEKEWRRRCLKFYTGKKNVFFFFLICLIAPTFFLEQFHLCLDTLANYAATTQYEVWPQILHHIMVIFLGKIGLVHYTWWSYKLEIFCNHLLWTYKVILVSSKTTPNT